jgi:hypothetical protein
LLPGKNAAHKKRQLGLIKKQPTKSRQLVILRLYKPNGKGDFWVPSPRSGLGSHFLVNFRH